VSEILRFAQDEMMNHLGSNPSNTSTDSSTPAGIGYVAALAVLKFRHNDGSNHS
jgi:hypothetical protein